MGVEKQFMRAMHTCNVADLKSIEALQGKQQRLQETLTSTLVL